MPLFLHRGLVVLEKGEEQPGMAEEESIEVAGVGRLNRCFRLAQLARRDRGSCGVTIIEAVRLQAGGLLVLLGRANELPPTLQTDP
jgi:hypothetical protein